MIMHAQRGLALHINDCYHSSCYGNYYQLRNIHIRIDMLCTVWQRKVVLRKGLGQTYLKCSLEALNLDM